MKKSLQKSYLWKSYQLLKSFLAYFLFTLFIKNKIKVIGITGTKGKTTSVELLQFVLNDNNISSASISSYSFTIKDKKDLNTSGNSMPSPFYIHKFIKKCISNKVKYLVIEVTSEGLRAYRHFFINFYIGAFLNLSKEHIESHGSFENYKKAKLSLFKYIYSHIKNNYHFFVNSESSYKEDFLNIDIKNTTLYSPLIIKNTFIDSSINSENIGCIFSICKFLGLKDIDIEKSIQEFKGVSGRGEVVIDKEFKVIVDYAHTPDSLEKVLKNYKDKSKGKLLSLVGSAGGGRDKWKRSEIGNIAGIYSDVVVVTNEDPFEEDEMKIIEEVYEGVLKSKKEDTYKIQDRGEAIKFILNKARKNDIVVITGKGSEKYIRIKNNIKIPWSDKEEVERFFK